MPSVELSRLQAPGAARALSESDRAPLAPRAQGGAARTNAPETSGRTSPGTTGISIEIGAAAGKRIETAAPPVDRERVAEIRKALEEGRYPLVPTEIADAMIAARVSLGLGK